MATAVALGVSELLAGVLPGATSLVAAVGQVIIDLQPPGAKDFMVGLFGTNDKLALELFIVVVALVLGALLGVVARRRYEIAAIAFVAFGVVGYLAALGDPLAEPAIAAVATAISIGSGLLVLGWLLDHSTAAVRVVDSGDSGGTVKTAQMPDWSRRAFMIRAGAIGVGAVAIGVVGRNLLERQRTAPVGDGPAVPPASVTVPAFGADADFSHDRRGPDADHHAQRQVLPDRHLAPHAERRHGDMVAADPRPGRSRDDPDLGSAHRTPRLRAVRDDRLRQQRGRRQARRQREVDGRPPPRGPRHRRRAAAATQLVGRSVDGWTAGMPTAWVMDPSREPMIALKMNDEPLPPIHGYPARLIVPGLYGYVSATKWLKELELTTLEAFDGYWVPLGWAKEAPILTQSRIDTPRGGVNAGQVAIAGVAWAPDRGISRVEVAVDGVWRDARLSTPLAKATWVQWVTEWAAEPGSHVLMVRATDGTGAVQTEQPSPPAPDGARGYHTVSVEVS